MGRHTITLALLPGVEYDEDDQSLYIDVPSYVAQGGRVPGKPVIDSVTLEVMRRWRKDMPAYPVRVYQVRGVG